MRTKNLCAPRAISTLALTAALGFGQAGAAADSVKLDGQQGKALGIETVLPKRQTEADMAPLPAQVVVPPGQVHVVSAPVSGLIEKVTVVSGAGVRKGDILARLASPQLAEIQRGLLQSVTQRQLAADALKRDQLLLNEGIIPESRLRATQGRYAEADASYAERRQALRLAGASDATIDQLKGGHALGSSIEIRAPMDGVVLEATATAGQRVEAASGMFRIARLKPLWLEIQVPVARVVGLTPGALVRVRSTSSAGKVVAIGSTVDGNQTVNVRAEISEGAQQLRPGQFVEATVASAASADAWRVPNSALARLEGRLVVFAQAKGGFLPKEVVLESEGTAESLVRGALTDETRVAIRGVAALKAAASGIGGK